MRAGSRLITAEERAAVETSFLAATDAWTKRKRMFCSIWCVLNNSEGKVPCPGLCQHFIGIC